MPRSEHVLAWRKQMLFDETNGLGDGSQHEVFVDVRAGALIEGLRASCQKAYVDLSEPEACGNRTDFDFSANLLSENGGCLF